MPTTVQFRRGTTAQNNAFTGAVGEITIDTDKDTIIVHDGATQGGFPLISSNDSDPTFSSSTASKPQLTLTNTADDATGPKFILESDRATPADNDVAGTIEFRASDDAGAQVLSASILSKITDVSNGSEDGNLEFAVHDAGSSTTIATIDATGLTINSGILAATTGSTVGNLTLANGSITDSSGTIDFDNENLTTTGTVTYGSLSDGTITITAFVDEDNMASNSATLVPTQQSVKAYVDAQDANIASDTLTFTNKTFDANGTGNSISNIETADFASTAFKDEDNMASNSATAVASQQSIKAYVDGEIGNLSSTTIQEGNSTLIVSDSGSNGTLTFTADGNTELTINDTSATFSGNVIVTGNLNVNGTTTTVATSNTVVSDSLIELANGTTGTPANDAGIVIERGDSNNAFIGFDESEDKFKVGTGTFTGASTGNLTISTGTLVANLEGNVTGAVTGNASTATALQTGRTIALSGDVAATGVTFDGTGNITLTTTIQANSVALGTDTTGNYVGTITGGNGISSSGATTGEGIAHTISFDVTDTAITKDEDNMASNSASHLATQQSIKAYVDNSIGAISSNSISAGNTSATITDAGTGNMTVTVDGTTHSVFAAAGITLSQGNFVGNASTATTLQTARTIGGVSFNGSANINLPGVNTTGNQDTSGTATNATNFNVAADNSTNATHYVIFTGGATGNQRPNSDTALTYNPSTNVLTTTASSARYADLAELYSADAEYEPGTVMSFGGDQEITQSTQSHDPRVAGVVSTAPAYLMNADLENGTALALQGRTPCKVIGRIHKGDMLVASQTPGVASALDPSSYTPGCVIGKALASYDSDSVGVIEVVVGRI